MTLKKLTFFQNFNAMRTFLNMYYDRTHAHKIGVMAGGLNLWKKNVNWQLNPQTFDPRAWDEWLSCVHKTLHDLNVQQNPEQFLYDQETAFLCMQNYFQYFYDQTSWQEVGTLVSILKQAQHVDADPVWQEWQIALGHVLNNSYELDLYFDPFSGDRM